MIEADVKLNSNSECTITVLLRSINTLALRILPESSVWNGISSLGGWVGHA